MSALDHALAGHPVERPLRAPLFAALAAEVEELDVQAFLGDSGRRARIYVDLWRSLRPDVLVVESGAGAPELVPDLLRRVRAVVPEPTLLGVVLAGPGATGSVQAVLGQARGAAEAGAAVIFVREDAATMPDGYARTVTPLWGALKFFRATGVLKAPWADQLPRGPFLPCVTAPLAAPHALAVVPGDAAPAGHGAALVTHTEDLLGHVPIRDLRSAVSALG